MHSPPAILPPSSSDAPWGIRTTPHSDRSLATTLFEASDAPPAPKSYFRRGRAGRIITRMSNFIRFRKKPFWPPVRRRPRPTANRFEAGELPARARTTGFRRWKNIALWAWRLAVVGWLIGSRGALAGGGPENVFLVVNSASWASQAVANQYIHLRHIPADNVVYLDWDGGFEATDIATFRQQILGPVLQTLERARPGPANRLHRLFERLSHGHHRQSEFPDSFPNQLYPTVLDQLADLFVAERRHQEPRHDRLDEQPLPADFPPRCARAPGPRIPLVVWLGTRGRVAGGRRPTLFSLHGTGRHQRPGQFRPARRSAVCGAAQAPTARIRAARSITCKIATCGRRCATRAFPPPWPG